VDCAQVVCEGITKDLMCNFTNKPLIDVALAIVLIAEKLIKAPNDY